MKPVDQSSFGGKDGNCWSSCIASILELPGEEVPNFCLKDNWFVETWNWLHARGYASIYTSGSDAPIRPHCWHIVSGNSPRGKWLHAVVAMGEKLIHDPHPSRAFLAGPVVDSWVIVPKEILR